ncbi:MAG: hypothetical protein ACRERV_13720, partial [Methylococcales bacterium]
LRSREANRNTNKDLIMKMIQQHRHTGRACPGRDCRGIAGIQSTEMCLGCHPWPLGSGNPCRNDGFIGWLKHLANQE